MAFRDLIESKKYLKVRKKYLEMSATFPNRKLDARVNSLLLQEVQQEIKEYPTPISDYDAQFDELLKQRNELIMEAKEKSPQKREKKKPSKKKDKNKITYAWTILLERYTNRSKT